MLHLPPRYPEELPVSARRAEILAALRAHQVLVIAGETGSGKTTQLPKLCLEAGLAERGRIGCTQPRRVAALSVSRRVAEELGVNWGREVGCKIRFGDDTSRETMVKFMTDGILLAEIQSDPLLRAYSALILDEAHERSLNIDFLLGHLKSVLARRPELKLVITSATIDTAAFSAAFGNAPIIEVSGRLWPVEIRYAPLGVDPEDEDGEELSLLDAVVRETENALLETNDGDVLVFLPTEREIRETCERLEDSLGRGLEVLPLYGRMPAADQQRIFAPSQRRRVIVATNIAETSLTLPRIRFVIDSGLARLSRYNPRTRTKRLPVERVSQSSANQRAGRAGRVQAGVCVRLYDEADFEKRPRFTQPEIQRANLAEVILRLKAFRLGDIESFPFVDPPAPGSIKAGYALLRELGALDEAHALTPTGRELARLPIDPALGRMLLEARAEGVLAEVLVIAAGLSVPDPRERPEDQREAAASAHRAFAHPQSDFLSLLKLWKAAPEAEGKGATSALRRFGKANFLSFVRMREWRDVQRQLADVMREGPRPGARPTKEEDVECAVHRSILTGLLGQIAQREKPNHYKATGGRNVVVFPGSHLFQRAEKSSGPRKLGNRPETKAKQPEWIVAGEIVETSQLFARTLAGIDPAWVLEFGAHLCRFLHVEPHWSAKAGRVLVTERVLFHGLEIARRPIDYGKIDSRAATEMFIRGALVDEEARLPLRFFQENRKVREKLENALTRVRNRWAHSLEESLFQFYAARLENVSSVPDLNRLVRERSAREPNFLIATEEDLIGGEASFDRAQFPDAVRVADASLTLQYAYDPGEEHDGVTLRVPLPLAPHLTSGELQWMVPGLREELIAVLLRALPKTARKALQPHAPQAAALAAEFDPGREEFLPALAAFLSRKYRVEIQASDWPADSIPAHLRPRLEVVDSAKKTVIAGRDLPAVQAVVEKHDVKSDAWSRAAQRWERYAVTGWSFGDLPESVVIETIGGVPVLAWPGLEREADDTVNVRLFRKREEALAATPAGLRRLGELALAKDLAWSRRELNALGKLLPSITAKPAGGFHDALKQLGAKMAAPPRAEISADSLQRSAYEHLLRRVFTLEPLHPLNAARFAALVESARRALPLVLAELNAWAKQTLAARAATLAQAKPYPGLAEDVARLVPPDFLAATPPAQMPHLLRYLKAVAVRAERAHLNPAKDAEKARRLAPFARWEERVAPENRESFRWLLEEFRVSLFAQELGTAQPVSEKRLQALLP